CWEFGGVHPLHANQQRALAGPAKEHPMAMRLPASQRTREELSALIEGRLRTASAKDELVRLATRLIVEEALPFLLPNQAFFNRREKIVEPLFCTIHFRFVKLNLSL